ncbi:ATP-binding protein [Sphingobacterium bambusae]|uniref:histidine kinase n=1 Tax=Sphingobacterium bambusae TaxID=662858 RepID=A0ABW6BBY0_9SPHI|nr:ATP-binding protein [Sphingobacterium bambusae]WPL48488.1 ATP-binding protein [Sphingobacterium bambusae]
MNNAAETTHTYFDDSLLLLALKSSPEPVAIYSEENMIIRFANQGMLKLWGKEALVVGRPLLDAIPELTNQPFLSILQNVWTSGETYAVRAAPVELMQDGVRRLGYYDFEYKAIIDESGKTRCILNTAREVTYEKEYLEKMLERADREEALTMEMSAALEEISATNEDLLSSMRLLSDSREEVKTIIEQAPVGMTMLKGPEHIIEIANPAILHIWGRTANEVVGRPHRLARPELAGQPVYDWLDQVYATGERRTNKEFAVNLYNNGGSRQAIVNSIYQPIFSGNGAVTGVLVILEEITEQVTARRKNEKDQHMLTLALDAGHLATFYYEIATNLFAGNDLLYTWFALEPSKQIQLSNALAMIVEDDRKHVADAITRSLSRESNGDYAMEYSIQTPNDTAPRLVQARGKVFYDNDGNAISLNGTLRDITEQKKDEQRKDDFIGMVSHELKTPLTSLRAYLQLMQRAGIISTKMNVQAALDKSLRQVQSMTGMINGFLNISRLDAGKMMLNRSYFNFKALFTQLQDDVLHTVLSHHVVFLISGDVQIYADREKIEQVMHNLIGNAVKYSPPGSRIDLTYSVDDGRFIMVRVSDEGMGIAQEDHNKIFERYYRVNSTKMGSIAGFGIGLHLCREIIELHQGTISVEHSGGNGTTFKLVLPLQST